MDGVVAHAVHNVLRRKPVEDKIKANPQVFYPSFRSNSFFREMAAFISTKNPTQCRSYHQKYENKYKFPHRIIRQEKERLDMSVYDSLLAKRKSSLMPAAGQLHQPRPTVEGERGRARREKPEVRGCECQTDIQGVSTVLIQP